MSDAVASSPENRAPEEEGKAEDREGTADAGHGEAQGITEDQQESSRDDSGEQKSGGDGAGEEEEEPGECGFCLFMKSGPCRDSFVNWEECIEQAEKDKEDMVEKCHKVTFMLKECMEHNSNYYEPVLQAEKAMGEAALEEQEEEEAVAAAAAAVVPQGGGNGNASDSQVPLQSESELSPHTQGPEHVGTEEYHSHTDEQHTKASSDEHPTNTFKPDADAGTQEHPSA